MFPPFLQADNSTTDAENNDNVESKVATESEVNKEVKGQNEEPKVEGQKTEGEIFSEYYKQQSHFSWKSLLASYTMSWF